MPRSLTLLLLAFCLLLAPGLATASTWSPHFLPAWALDLGRTDPGDVAGLAALGCPTRAVLPIILASATSADADLVESYAYDANGNVEFVTTGASSVDAYTYDELDRLTDADFFDGSSISYTWDDAGNLQARSGSSPSLDALDFDLSAYTWTYNHVPGWAYDGAGQVLETTSSAEVLSWHPTGKPSALQGDDHVEITYDHAGRRSVVRWCETDSTCTGDETYDLYLYDPDGRVLARLQSPAADTRPLLQELYIYAGGQLLGFLDFSSGWSNGRPFWVHTDLQGSLRLVTDASGEAMQELRWSPMGTLLSTSAPMLQDALAFAWQPLAYRGVPVVDVGARVRHAEYGWFLSPDPVAWGEPSDPQTFHRSQYARGNPMTYVDPWGEAPAFVYATQAASMIVASAPERMQRTDSVAGASAWAAVALAGAAYQDLANAPLDQQVVLGLVTGGGFGLVRSRLARVGASRGLSNKGGVFTTEENAAGGRVVTAVGDISHTDVATQVTSGLYAGGDVRVLSGAHGLPNGTIIPEASFLAEDLTAFGSIPGVTVSDVTTMSAAQIRAALQSPGTTIGAFCNSGPCLAPFK
jgi:YD repeat-containing protein